MPDTKKIWCKVKSTIIATLISLITLGIGYTSYHIIYSDNLNAQQTSEILISKDEIKRLNEKIDSTQPAAISEKIKSLEKNQVRLEAKIDYNEQVRREQYQNQMLRQDKIYEILLEIKKNNR